MDDAAFESRFNELLRQIQQLPPDRRPALEALAAETRSRHREIRASGERAHAALQRLTILAELAVLNRFVSPS